MELNPNSKKWQVQLDVVYELMSEELNNEESVGNATRSRTQIDQDGNVRNKISGASTKHQIMANVHSYTENFKKELCKTCREFNPVKVGEFVVDEADKERLSASGKRTKGCVLCDIAGFLNIEKGANEKRESVIKVSDAIAEVSGTRKREMHSRLDSNESALTAKTKDGEGSTNMIFYSENRNSTYHQSVVIDLDRIGFDDHHQVYTLPLDQLKKRIEKALKGTIQQFIDVNGAKTATHKPHTMRVEGTVREITDSQEITLSYSAANEDYMDVASYFNKDMEMFNNPKELKQIIDSLLEEERMDAIISRNMAVVDSWK